MKKLALAGIAIGLLSLPQATPAQQMEALLNKLVKKGVLTQKEAEDVEADMQQDEKKEGRDKVRVSELAEKLTLFGDLRLRYEYRDVQNGFDNLDDGRVEPDGPDSRDDVSRLRYRLRVGARVAFRDDLEFGFRLASGNEAEEVTSTNDTFGDAFGKDGIYIDQVYLKWSGLDGLTLMAGKFDMPMWTTEMFWDHDVTPEGGFEQYTWKAGKWEFTLNAAQLCFADVSEVDEDTTDTGGNHHDNLADDGSRAVVNDDGWIFAGQAIAKFEWIPKKSDGRIGVSYWYFANAEDLSTGSIGSDGYASDTGQRTRATGIVYTAPGSGNNLGREFRSWTVCLSGTSAACRASRRVFRFAPSPTWPGIWHRRRTPVFSWADGTTIRPWTARAIPTISTRHGSSALEAPAAGGTSPTCSPGAPAWRSGRGRRSGAAGH